MPNTDWEKYVVKRPLQTYKEKIDGVEARLNDWAKSKRYRQHGLKLNDVATELGIASMHISFCVNARKKLSFTAWLNSLRIADAKKMIEKNPMLLISEVSLKVGFSGPATFKPNFIQFAGCTLEEWIEQLKSEYQNDCRRKEAL